MMPEWSLLFFPCLTQCSGWWDGRGAERKGEGRYVCMYVRTMDVFLSSLSSSLSSGKERLDCAVSGGWAGRTGVPREVSNRSGSREGLSTWTCRGKRTDVRGKTSERGREGGVVGTAQSSESFAVKLDCQPQLAHSISTHWSGIQK